MGEHPCRSVISIEITLLHGCSPVNLLRIFRTLFYKNTSGGLLLNFDQRTSGQCSLFKYLMKTLENQIFFDVSVGGEREYWPEIG